MSRGFITVLESILLKRPNVALVRRRRQVADAKQRVVLGVQRFDANLDPDAVAESEILRQSQIHQVMRLEPHVRQRRRERADVRLSQPDFRGLECDDLSGRVAERLAIEGVEARRIEDRHVDAVHLAAVGLAPLRRQIAWIAAARIEVGVLVEDQRHARLPLVLRAELPAAEDGGDDRVPVVAPLVSRPERQLRDAGEGDAVGPIDGAHAAFQIFPGVERRDLLAKA